MSASAPDLRPLLDFLDATDTTRKRIAAAAGAPFRENVRRLGAERDARALLALAGLPEREPVMLHTAVVVADVASPWMLEPAHQLILATQDLVPLLGATGGTDLGALIGGARRAYAQLATAEDILAHIERYKDAPGLDGVGALERLRQFYCAATAKVPSPCSACLAAQGALGRVVAELGLWLGVRLIEAGMAPAVAAKASGASRASAYRWWRRYQGVAGAV
jgi:hypothetical protein